MSTLVNSEESDEMPHYIVSALFGKNKTKLIFREKKYNYFWILQRKEESDCGVVVLIQTYLHPFKPLQLPSSINPSMNMNGEFIV